MIHDRQWENKVQCPNKQSQYSIIKILKTEHLNLMSVSMCETSSCIFITDFIVFFLVKHTHTMPGLYAVNTHTQIKKKKKKVFKLLYTQWKFIFNISMDFFLFFSFRVFLFLFYLPQHADCYFQSSPDLSYCILLIWQAGQLNSKAF